MAEQYTDKQKSLKGKIFITAKLKVLTGMHIGGNNSFAPIGAVDTPFIRDVLTHEPIIPGSSLKGKLRTLLAKSKSTSYILNKIENDDISIGRLFGFVTKESIVPARLQFFDLFLNKDNLELFKNIETDTYIGEIKYENTINRITGVANPRQIERVPAGAEFDFKLIYNIENEEELSQDMQTLAEGFELLHMDYLGGHGSRGYGRVHLYDFKIKELGNVKVDTAKYIQLFERSYSL